jgi:hypothetical protein
VNAQRIPWQAVAADVHDESPTNIHATLYAPVLREFCLEASREDEGRNWYIEVSDESGYHLYDGYWRNSECKSCAEVMAEAADGSLLHELKPSPEGAHQIASPAPALEYECEDCNGTGHTGEPARYMGEFQPPEVERCDSCNGTGRWSRQQELPDDKTRQVVLDCQETGAMYAKAAMSFELGAAYRVRQQERAAQHYACARALHSGDDKTHG